jgi:hypothetical protein
MSRYLHFMIALLFCFVFSATLASAQDSMPVPSEDAEIRDATEYAPTFRVDLKETTERLYLPLVQGGAFSCAAVKEIPQHECEALVALWIATNGGWPYPQPVWNQASGWLATLTPCTWYGIRCAEGHVISSYPTIILLEKFRLR